MTNAVEAALSPSVIAMVSLAANIAANHPKKAQCQLARLREMGVPGAQIDMVVDIARHLRDEAGQMADSELDAASHPAANVDVAAPATKGNACC